MDIKKILQQIDKVNEGYRDYPDDDVDYDRFAQKGSALHSADKNNPRDQDCPTCGEENVLTRRDVAKGYQCDTCADRAEGKIQYESKKPSLKDYFHKIDEDATSGMKPLPMLDPKKQQVGAAVITSTNPTIQKILKNLTPQDVQVIQTMTKTGQPNQSGTQPTGTTTGSSAGSMQPMKEASDSEPTVNGKVVDVYSLDFEGIDTTDYPDFADAYIVSGSFEDGTEMSDAELEEFQDKYRDLVHKLVHDRLYEGRNATDDEHKKTLDTLLKRPDLLRTLRSLKKRDQDDKYNTKKEKEFKDSLAKEEVEQMDEGSRYNADGSPKNVGLKAAKKFGKEQDRKTTLHHFAKGAAKDDLSKFKKEEAEQIDEAGSVHLVGKYEKGGVTYHLWQDLKDGGYSYHLTKLVNGKNVRVKNYAGYSMPEAQADLTRRGFGLNLLKKKEKAEQGMAEGVELNELSIDLLNRAAAAASDKEDRLRKARFQNNADYKLAALQGKEVDYDRAAMSDLDLHAQRLRALDQSYKFKDAADLKSGNAGKDHNLDYVQNRAKALKPGTLGKLKAGEYHKKAKELNANEPWFNRPTWFPNKDQNVAEGKLNEKWGTETKVAPSEKGKYKGKTKAELLKHYNKLKKSGPHKKGSKEYGTMRELSFAIRAKSGWGKVKEAERPPNQVDMGAGLGAGRSQTVLESNMKKTCQAAYHEGKSHGLGGHAYTCRHDEGTDEHMHYHNGFKEGLDECYGIEPMRGVVDETMAATVPGMASQAMKESDSYEDDESVYYDDEDDEPVYYDDEHNKSVYPDDEDDESVYYDDEDDIDEDTLGAVVGGALGGYATRSVKGAMTGAQLGSAAQDEFSSAFQKEGNAFTGALAKAKKGEKFSLGGHTYTDTSNAFESLDRQLNALLNEGSVSEGISVSISKGQQGGQDSVSITATDAEADNLLALVRNAGMGIFADEQKATSDYGAPVTDEGHADVEEHDSILGMMKKMAGIQDSHDSAQEDHSDCGCGQTPRECEEVTEEESEDQMEYEVAEDATEVAMTNADEESEAAEDQAIATADAKEDELNEWANEAMVEAKKLKKGYGLTEASDPVTGRIIYFHNGPTQNEYDIINSVKSLWNLVRSLNSKGVSMPAKEVQMLWDKAAGNLASGFDTLEYLPKLNLGTLLDNNSKVLSLLKSYKSATPAEKQQILSQLDSNPNWRQGSWGFPAVSVVSGDKDITFSKQGQRPPSAIYSNYDMSNMEDAFIAASEIMKDRKTSITKQLHPDEKLDEWANEAMKRGTEEAFTTGDEFMLDTISSGLNKKKSTGQTTIPIISGQADRMGYNESLKSWIQLVS